MEKVITTKFDVDDRVYYIQEIFKYVDCDHCGFGGRVKDTDDVWLGYITRIKTDSTRDDTKIVYIVDHHLEFDGVDLHASEELAREFLEMRKERQAKIEEGSR